MANVSGSVRINNITDADMVKLYQFKEKHGSAFTFNLYTVVNGGQPVPPYVDLGWTKLEGAEAVVALMKELQAKP